jgi:hypothetical protein
MAASHVIVSSAATPASTIRSDPSRFNSKAEAKRDVNSDRTTPAGTMPRVSVAMTRAANMGWRRIRRKA